VTIARWASRHARSILFLLSALVICGLLAAAFVVPVSLFPNVSFPRIRIHLDAGERPAERMVVEVTREVEEAVRAVPGIRRVNSATSRGSAELWLSFDWGQDMTVALLQTESQINKVLPTLPSGTTFEIRRMDPTVFPVIAYSLTSPARPLSELRDLAQFQLRPVLTTLPGVARISVAGGAREEYRVVVDRARLAAHNLVVSDVAAALGATNVVSVAGQIEDRYKLDLVVADTRLKSAQDIEAVVLRSGPGGVVRLSQVATVRRDVAPEFTMVTADGQPAVQLDVFQQPGGNTVEVARSIRAALDAEQRRLPPDVKITCWYDQSDLITQSAHSVRDAVIIGVILAALVLLLFLRNWRITLVAALTVPTVLAVTALLLYLLGQSFNIMTLGGMAAAVGLIIDDAIVMSEHIIRRLHRAAGTGADAESRVLAAADEFSRPLAGSSLSTIVIHIPPAFMVGVAGAFFASLSLSMASSLVVSFFVAWLAIPVLAARFLRSHRVDILPTEQPGRPPRFYPRLMRPILAHPWVILLLILPLLVAGYLTYERLPSGFMPAVDEGGFVIDYVGPPGTSLTEMDRMLKQVEAILHKTPEVQTFSRRTGFGLGEDLSETNMGDFFVRLKPFPRRDIEEVMDDVAGQIHKTIPALDIDPAQLMEDLIGDLTGRPQPVVVNLFGEDEALLRETAEKVAAAIKVPGVEEIRNGIIPAGDSLVIDVDRVKASLEGVDPEEISKSLTDQLSGNVATEIQQGEKLVGVRVWIPQADRRTAEDVEQLQLRAPDGHLFPLKRVASLHTITGEPEITREDLRRVVSVTARSSRDLGSTVRDVRAVLDKPEFLPAGVRYTLGGMYEQQQIAFRGLVLVMAAGAGLVFLLLLFLYESFRVAVSIMITTLLAMACVFMGLWVTRTQLDISSLMGMVMIVGNVTEVAIFYYSEYVDLPREHASGRERLIEAGTHRMRAITMTTVAAILALMPLALGIGHGSAMLQPLAIAIIAGLIVQLPLVLILLPAMLSLLRAVR